MAEQKSTATRLDRGIMLADTADIVLIADGIYHVAGSREVPYTIDLIKGFCSCPDRAELCKHRIAAQLTDSRNRRRPKLLTLEPGDSLKGVLADPQRLDRLAERLAV